MSGIPRLVLAGASSGVGKTTTTVALARALRARGLRVAAFKCGPDYLDPTYLARATDAPCHNLDGWMMGREAVLKTFAHVCAQTRADLALVEGMMGLFDGATPTDEAGSTAELAKWLEAPVVLLVDASGLARSLAALVQGYARFDPGLRVAAVVANRIGGRGHLDLLRAALFEPPVVGGFPVEAALVFPERHLGLHTASDPEAVPESLLARWGALAAEWLDLDRLLAIARSTGALSVPPARPAAQAAARCRIGLAFDQAFHFYYDDNLRRLEALGAELVRFSPVGDTALPAVDGLYFGGGYPEAAAPALAANQAMRAAVRGFAARGGPVYAECGGLMYLSGGIRTLGGALHEMVGLVPGEAVMSDRLAALGYVEVVTQAPSLLGPAGLRFRGHEFRYSELRPPPDVANVYRVQPRWGGAPRPEGYRVGSVLASYVHAHWASCPAAAEGLVAACTAFRETA